MPTRSVEKHRRHPRDGLRYLEQQVPSYAERNDYLDAPAALAPTQRLSVEAAQAGKSPQLMRGPLGGTSWSIWGSHSF